MPSAIAQAEVNRQMENAVVELEDASAQGRVNIFLARMAGGVASLVGRRDLTTRVGAILSGLTLADLLEGAITNIDPHSIDATRPIDLPSPEEMARQHPVCDDESLVERMQAEGDRHVQLCVQGDVNRATEVATSALALEDIGRTLAVLGRFDRAAAFIDAQAVNESARKQVRFVILLEKCRRALPGFAEEILQARLEGFGRLQVILALAGRLPWVGYPYSDGE
jgi:hypothetical protein